MKRFLSTAFLVLLQSAAGAAPSGYEVSGRIAIPGSTQWDKLRYDSVGHRLYIAQAPTVSVVDTDKGSVVGTIPGAGGTHDIAIDHELNRGFYSTGELHEIGSFDLDTLAQTGKIELDGDHQNLLYDPRTKRLIGINSRLRRIAAYDPKRLKIVGKYDLDGPPKDMVVQKNGTIFVNIQIDNALIGIDPRTMRQVKRGEFGDCRLPTGLAVDPQWRMYTVCRNGKMIVWSPEGKMLKEQTIVDKRWSAGIDGAVWQDGHLFVANGLNATLLVIDEVRPNEFEVVETIPTDRGARTLAADPEHHRLYTVSADIDPTHGWSAPKPIDESLHVTVIERRE